MILFTDDLVSAEPQDASCAFDFAGIPLTTRHPASSVAGNSLSGQDSLA